MRFNAAQAFRYVSNLAASLSIRIDSESGGKNASKAFSNTFKDKGQG
jgi:hypothetical protein